MYTHFENNVCCTCVTSRNIRSVKSVHRHWMLQIQIGFTSVKTCSASVHNSENVHKCRYLVTLNSVHNSRKHSQMSIDHILTVNSVHNSRKNSQMSIDHIPTLNSVHNSRKHSQMSIDHIPTLNSVHNP